MPKFLAFSTVVGIAVSSVIGALVAEACAGQGARLPVHVFKGFPRVPVPIGLDRLRR